MKINPRFAQIPWWLIIGSFVLGAGFIGAVLLILKILGESAEKEGTSANSSGSRPAQQTGVHGEGQKNVSYSYVKKNASTVDYKPVDAKPEQKEQSPVSDTVFGDSESRTQTRTEYQNTAFYQTKREDNRTNTADIRRESADINKLFPRRYGKALSTFGTIFMVIGMAVSLVGLGTAAVGGDIGGLLVAVVMSSLLCLPGGIMFFCGKNRQAKASRFRKYHNIIGDGRSVNIEVLAETIPTTYDKACKDLQEMIDAGFFRGMYIDASSGCLTDNYDRIRRKKTKTARQKNKDGIFPEEARISELNDIIEDAYVSERMDRLESLTHSILEYIEKNPQKESCARQFKKHYLPTTVKILEAYAKFEKQESRGANVSAAMQDVEKIMDKLVSGFEKQLDALYDDEALDIASDIDVLENMMDMSGLTGADFRI